MNADNERNFRDLIDARKFNGNTLVSGEHWQKPTVSEILLVRDLIPLTDRQLANRLAVDERTIRNGNPARPGWCTPPGAVCAGWPDWGCRSITLSVTEDTLPDASEHETAIVSPVSLPDMWKVVKIGQTR
jgi:hypothetical protein